METVLAETPLIVSLAFAPDGRMLYAAKSGQVYAYREGQPPKELFSLAVAGGVETGLLGMALHPEYPGAIFVYYTAPDPDGLPLEGRISRFDLAGGSETLLVAGLPAYPDQVHHFGGALTTGPDGRLYLIFGDTNRTDRAQDPARLEGSILRYEADGTIPADNPFPGSPVYAFGIRNGFGLAWNPHTGALYQTGNGASCDDELNLIFTGENYGWGAYPYDACPYPDGAGRAPIYQWEKVIAPTNVVFYDRDTVREWQGHLLVCGFNEQRLWDLALSPDGEQVLTAAQVPIESPWNLCRVALAIGPDGWLYSATASTVYRIGR